MPRHVGRSVAPVPARVLAALLLELASLHALLEGRFRADALVQHLAHGQRRAHAQDVLAPDRHAGRGRSPRPRVPCAAPPRTASAARRSRGTRRWAACSSRRRANGSERSGSRRGRSHAACRATARRGRASGRRRRPSGSRCPGQPGGRPASRRCGGGSAPDAASWSRACPRGGRRSILTGRPDFRASSAAWPAIRFGYSSLPPKPPPVTAWITRILWPGRSKSGFIALCT